MKDGPSGLLQNGVKVFLLYIYMVCMCVSGCELSIRWMRLVDCCLHCIILKLVNTTSNP